MIEPYKNFNRQESLQLFLVKKKMIIAPVVDAMMNVNEVMVNVVPDVEVDMANEKAMVNGVPDAELDTATVVANAKAMVNEVPDAEVDMAAVVANAKEVDIVTVEELVPVLVV